MKRILTIVTITLTLTLTAAAQTGRQMKVYMKGGLVDKVQVDANASIGHSRTDLNGTVHDDFVSMVIKDAEGRNRQYLISQLDSLVMPNGRRVVFRGYTNVNSTPERAVVSPRQHPRRSSFSGKFPGAGTGNVTFYWTAGDRIRLDVGDESRATVSGNGPYTFADFVFTNIDLDADEYEVYYPGKIVTIPSVQTQIKPNSTDHIGASGDCGTAIATKSPLPIQGGDGGGSVASEWGYSFTLTHQAAYLCFLPHIDNLPSVKLMKIQLEASVNDATDAYPAGIYELAESGLYNGQSRSRTITLNLRNPDGSEGFFVGHGLATVQDTCAAYMVIAPQASNVHYAVTYYLTDTLSHITRTYVQRFYPGELKANTVYPVNCHIPEHLFRSVDLGLSTRWSSVNVGAAEPGDSGTSYGSWADAEAALLTQTKVTQWVAPTADEKQELLTKCTWARGTYNGQSGWFVTGAAPGLRDGQLHRLFIPAATNVSEAQCLEANYRRPVEALMVDLDLSDRSLWAVRNIGAGSADDYGEYYAWGETSQKSFYSYRDYPYYISNGNYWVSIGSNRDISGTEYDAAHVLWGGMWHMPSRAEWQVLIDECDWEWKSNYANGHSGYLLTSKSNGRTLFLPAAGNLRDANSSPSNGGTVAHYPTSERSTSYTDYIWALNCHTGWNSGKPYFGQYNSENHQYRPYGRVIRPVSTGQFDVESLKLNVNTAPSDWTFGAETATLRGSIASPLPLSEPLTVGFVVGDSTNIDISHCDDHYEQQLSLTGSFECQIDVFANLGQWYRAYVIVGGEYYYGLARHYGAEMIDLGLPSGTLWANINVGADREGDFGDYFAWGETSTKDSYTEANYKWRVNGSYLDFSENISGSKYDAAMAVMGPLWQMPTKAQFDELLNTEYVTRQLVDYQNASCWKFTSVKDPTKCIYLPKAGQRNGTTWENTDYGWYLVGDRYDSYRDWNLIWYSTNQPYFTQNNKYKGKTLRAVARVKSGETDERIVEVATAEADWTPTPGESTATLHGSFVSNLPLDEPATVGFVVGDSAVIDIDHCRLATTPQTLTREGSFTDQVDMYDNLGYWYRAYAVVDGQYYYGEAQQYGLVMVDLGLPGGTLWANMNVGAHTPIEAGGYYAWGESETKDTYTWDNYSLYDRPTNTHTELMADIQGTPYDAAMANLGTLWVTPTKAQVDELVNGCTWTRVLIDNVWCMKAKSKVNSNYILLPKVGHRDDVLKSYDNGYYMTSTSYDYYRLWYFYLYNFGYYYTQGERRTGFSVRAVVNKKNVVDDGRYVNVTTDDADWTLGQSQATLHGRFFSSVPLGQSVSVGFVLGDSVNIDKDHRSIVLPATLQSDGTFSATQSVYDNRGYWYRAYAVIDGTYYYGDVFQYGQIMVDLGLPNGTLWASLNVGASTTVDAGDYYAWGETETKDTYTWDNYWLYDRPTNVHTELMADIQGTQYDAAMANMGSLWVTPTKAQVDELINGCTWSRVMVNNVWCLKAKSKVNDNYILLPKVGHREEDLKSYNNGYYMTSTSYDHYRMWYFYLYNFGYYNTQGERRTGFSVRAVVNKKNQAVGQQTINVTTYDNAWTWNDTQVTLRGSLRSHEPFTGTATVGFLTGDRPDLDYSTKLSDEEVATVSDTCTFTKTLTVTSNQGRYYRAYVKIDGLYYFGDVYSYGLMTVDLGLPNGTLWANMNLGASRPEQPGDYYAWGETTTKDDYSSATYRQASLNASNIAGTERDAAYVNWGSGWQMPTKAQYDDLFNTTYCDHACVMIENRWCYRLTSKTTGQVLYLPAVGRYNGTSIDCTSDVRYWTATRYNDNNAWFAYCYNRSSFSPGYYDSRYFGLNIRPVRSQ